MGTAINDVKITITDGALANVTVPPAGTQACVGCSSSGTVGQELLTSNKNTVIATFGYGPLPEKMCSIIDAGGTALGVKTTTVTPGAVFATPAAITSVTSTGGTPDVFTKAAHGYSIGMVVTGSGFTTDVNANTTFVITAVTTNTFTAGNLAGSGGAGANGTVTPTGVVFTGSGTSVPTITGTPYDDYQPVFKVINGGTIGTAGITFQVSLDLGRTFGPVFALGTATSYAIPQSGITINFGSGTLVANDQISFRTTAPTWNDAGVSAAITALQSGPYQWGAGIHVVGVSAGSDATAFEGYVDTMANAYLYTFVVCDARDYKPADGTEAAWMTSILNDYAGCSCVRVLASGGWYNTRSSIQNQAVGGFPAYRRPGSWAAMRRLVALAQPQTLISRVADGPLGAIVVNPTTDPTDGQIYHDERVNPGLGSSGGNTGRFMSMRTRVGFGTAFFVDEPWMLSPVGSDFSMLPYRMVMDVGASLTHQVLQRFINQNLLLNPNGTIVEADARSIEAVGTATYNVNMTSQGMISSASFVLSRTDNIATTKTVNATGRFVALGYILEIDVSLGYQSPNQLVGS